MDSVDQDTFDLWITARPNISNKVSVESLSYPVTKVVICTVSHQNIVVKLPPDRHIANCNLMVQ